MGIMSKRVAVWEINIDENGRDHGEIQRIFELDPNKLIIREVKTMKANIIKECDFDSCKFDIFKSSDVKEQSVIGTAVAGGLLFGGAGAVVGAIAGKGKDSWVFEIVEGDSVKLYRIKNDSDKMVLEKYLNKHSI